MLAGGGTCRGLADLGFFADACQCSRLNPHNRVNCGFPGISSDECFSRGCCFDSSVVGVPWCFNPLPKQGNGQGPLLSPGQQPRTQLPQAV